MRAKRQNADAEHVTVVESRCGKEHALLGVDSLQQASVQFIQLFRRSSARDETEGQQGKLGIGHNFDIRDFFELLRGPAREIQLFVEVLSKRAQSVHF